MSASSGVLKRSADFRVYSNVPCWRAQPKSSRSGGDVQAGIVWEDERRLQIVIDRDIDLTAAAAVGVDYKRRRSAVALREIAVEQADPALLAGGSACAGCSNASRPRGRRASACE